MCLEVDEWLTELRPDPEALVHVALLFETQCRDCFTDALPTLLELAPRHSQVSFFAVASAFDSKDREEARALVEGGVFGQDQELNFEFRRSVPVALDRLAEATPERIQNQARKILGAMQMQAPLMVSDDVALERIAYSLRERENVAGTYDGNAALGTPTWLIFNPRTFHLYYNLFGHVPALELESKLIWLVGMLDKEIDWAKEKDPPPPPSYEDSVYGNPPPFIRPAQPQYRAPFEDFE